MGYRGSKSVIGLSLHRPITVKEQRVDGSSVFKYCKVYSSRRETGSGVKLYTRIIDLIYLLLGLKIYFLYIDIQSS